MNTIKISFKQLLTWGSQPLNLIFPFILSLILSLGVLQYFVMLGGRYTYGISLTNFTYTFQFFLYFWVQIFFACLVISYVVQLFMHPKDEAYISPFSLSLAAKISNIVFVFSLLGIAYLLGFMYRAQYIEIDTISKIYARLPPFSSLLTPTPTPELTIPSVFPISDLRIVDEGGMNSSFNTIKTNIDGYKIFQLNIKNTSTIYKATNIQIDAKFYLTATGLTDSGIGSENSLSTNNAPTVLEPLESKLMTFYVPVSQYLDNGNYNYVTFTPYSAKAE